MAGSLIKAVRKSQNPIRFRGGFFPAPKKTAGKMMEKPIELGTGCGLQSSSGIAGFESSRQGFFPKDPGVS